MSILSRLRRSAPAQPSRDIRAEAHEFGAQLAELIELRGQEDASKISRDGSSEYELGLVTEGRGPLAQLTIFTDFGEEHRHLVAADGMTERGLAPHGAQMMIQRARVELHGLREKREKSRPAVEPIGEVAAQPAAAQPAISRDEQLPR